MTMFNSLVKWPSFFQLLIFTDPMSRTRHHYRTHWKIQHQEASSVFFYSSTFMNIEHLVFSKFKRLHFFLVFSRASFSPSFTSQEGLEFPAHSHYQRPDLVAPRGLLLLPGHQEGRHGGPSESLGWRACFRGKMAKVTGGFFREKWSINRGFSMEHPIEMEGTWWTHHL